MSASPTSTPASTSAPSVLTPAGEAPRRPGGPAWLREVRTSSWLVSLLAVVLAFVLGGLLIAAADPATQEAAGYFFARPGDMVSRAWSAASGAYGAMLRGAVYDPQAGSAAQRIRPITETLTVATPLIAAGLGVALAFRAGLFNIGAQGQLLAGATLAGYVGFAWHLPVGLHLLVALVAALAGGAVWGGVVGWLRARTGAPEVIVTIMLNYVALNLLAYLLTTHAFQRPGGANPISPPVDTSAALPLLLGSQFRLHLGFPLVLLAAVGMWWLLERSTLGFRFRAVGANPAAARTAGMSVGRSYTGVMVIAGALAGLAGAAQLLGTEKSLTGGIAATIGSDAITVALLGRSTPLGTVLAGLLFGALRAGGVLMQAQTGTPIDIVLVVQSVIVLLIAAPPLVRSIFRLTPRAPGGSRRSRRRQAAAAGGAA